jgi:hypothetical protein
MIKAWFSIVPKTTKIISKRYFGNQNSSLRLYSLHLAPSFERHV